MIQSIALPPVDTNMEIRANDTVLHRYNIIDDDTSPHGKRLQVDFQTVCTVKRAISEIHIKISDGCHLKPAVDLNTAICSKISRP